MLFSPRLRLVVGPLDEGLELGSINPPDAPPADLDRRKPSRSDERVDLRNAHVEVSSDVLEREKAWLDSGCASPPFVRLDLVHWKRKVPPANDVWLYS